MMDSRMSNRIWSIVRAGVDGDCIRAFIQRWLGRPKPKQYCAFVGGRSPFQYTLDRAARLSRQERIVTLITREYQREAWSQLDGRSGGMVLLQPTNCDTVAGIYLPLTYIRTRDPQATVVVYPSDHFVYPEHRFLDSVQWAVWTVEWLPDRLVFLGVSPDRLVLDYEWITPGEKLDGSVKYQINAVDGILEEPTAAQADTALARGALWNTSVLVAKGETLWELGWQCFPDLMRLFEGLSQAIGTPQEKKALDAIRREMRAYNFASDLLQRVPERVAVLEMTGVLWSDWGKPERIAGTLRQIGRQPVFPLECLGRPFAPIPILRGGDSMAVHA